MEFDYAVHGLGAQEVTVWDSYLISSLGKQDQENLQKIVDMFGMKSAKAQGLNQPVTSLFKLKTSDHRLYLYAQRHGGRTVILGGLKVGRKKLFITTQAGRIIEIEPLSVLDFYVHESCQRMGLGNKIFDTVLREENTSAANLAYDRPSPKLLGFLQKHYMLYEYVPQANNFVVFDKFFTESQSSTDNRNRPWASVSNRPLTAQKDKFKHAISNSRPNTNMESGQSTLPQSSKSCMSPSYISSAPYAAGPYVSSSTAQTPPSGYGSQQAGYYSAHCPTQPFPPPVPQVPESRSLKHLDSLDEFKEDTMRRSLTDRQSLSLNARDRDRSSQGASGYAPYAQVSPNPLSPSPRVSRGAPIAEGLDVGGSHLYGSGRVASSHSAAHSGAPYATISEHVQNPRVNLHSRAGEAPAVPSSSSMPYEREPNANIMYSNYNYNSPLPSAGPTPPRAPNLNRQPEYEYHSPHQERMPTEHSMAMDGGSDPYRCNGHGPQQPPPPASPVYADQELSNLQRLPSSDRTPQDTPEYRRRTYGASTPPYAVDIGLAQIAAHSRASGSQAGTPKVESSARSAALAARAGQGAAGCLVW